MARHFYTRKVHKRKPVKSGERAGTTDGRGKILECQLWELLEQAGNALDRLLRAARSADM